jgi:hypothetical protein
MPWFNPASGSVPGVGGFSGATSGVGGFGARSRGTSGMGSIGGVGSGLSGMGSSATGSGGTGSNATGSFGMGTPGHDTHPDWEDPDPERDPSQGFYNDRRAEGRRHQPQFGASGQGEVPDWLKKAVERHKRSRHNGRTIWHPDIQTEHFAGLEPGESQGYWGKSGPQN